MTSTKVSMSGELKNMAAPISLFIHVRSCSFQTIPSKTRAGVLIHHEAIPASTPRQASYPTAGRETESSPSDRTLLTQTMGVGTLIIRSFSGEGQHLFIVRIAHDRQACRTPIRSGKARILPLGSLLFSAGAHCRRRSLDL